ncbi:DNA alkylation repair protein [Microbacterium sp. P5_E9]
MPGIVEVVREALRAAADPARAPGQQAYMKSEMPFLGVTLPEVRRLVRSAASQTADAAILRAAASELWDDASHREERYAGMLLLGLRPTRAQWENVTLIEYMVRTGRWWDITDELAHRLAELHDVLPRETADLVRRWSTDAELWVRRIAILSQLGRRDRVDRELLAGLIEPNRPDSDFFIRKAIGWALREYARVDPDWVRDYVATHELSPLSRREALKHLTP